MMTCAQFAARLERAAIRAKNELDIPTEAVMVIVEAQAREVIGTYRYGWPELAPSTQADRVSKGYPADEPLLRTGEMAASIAHKSETTATGAEGLVYSGDVVALWQELGTTQRILPGLGRKRHIPPRSFLYQSLLRAVPDMGSAFGKFAEQILLGA